MKPPIFVCADDVYVFASKEEAESSIEPADVEPDERGYDAEGRLLRVVVRGEVKERRWAVDQSRARVELILTEDEPAHRDELRARLSDWFKDEGATALASGSLEQLVELAARRSAAMAPNPTRNYVFTLIVLALVLVTWWWLSR